MNLKTIHELTKCWAKNGFAIECGGCEDEPEILTVYPSEDVVECIKCKCGNLFQVLDLFVGKLQELNE